MAASKEAWHLGEGDDCSPLLCSHEHLLHCVQLWGSQCKNVHLGSCLCEVTVIIKGLGKLPYRGRLKELELFGLEKRRLWRELIVVFQYLKEKRLLRRMRRNSLSGLEQPCKLKVNLDIMKPTALFTMRVLKHRNGLSRVVAVDVSTLEVFKSRLDGAVSKLV